MERNISPPPLHYSIKTRRGFYLNWVLRFVIVPLFWVFDLDLNMRSYTVQIVDKPRLRATEDKQESHLRWFQKTWISQE